MILIGLIGKLFQLFYRRQFMCLDKNYFYFHKRYDPISEQWRPCAPMSVPRNRVGVAVMDEFLYAVGGAKFLQQFNNFILSVKKYIFRFKWDRISQLSRIVSALKNKKKII